MDETNINTDTAQLSANEDDFTIETGHILKGRLSILQNQNARKKLYRPTILFMVLLNSNASNHVTNIAFVTDNFKYYEFNVGFRRTTHHITDEIRKRFHIMFSQFIINEKTSIVILDTVDFYSPLSIYFNIVKLYSNAYLTRIGLHSVLTRIYSNYRIFKRKKTGFKIEKNNINSYTRMAWDHILKEKICPWITNTIQRQLSLMTPKQQRLQRRIRIVLFYIYFKTRARLRNQQCQEKKLLKNINQNAQSSQH